MSSIEKMMGKMSGGGNGRDRNNGNEIQPGRDERNPNQNIRAVDLDFTELGARGFLTPRDSNSLIGEEYRAIKQPLLQYMAATGAATSLRSNLIMITSAMETEGKSFTAINLAISMAMELDRTVLLIDGDVARAGIAHTLGLPSSPGLTDVLTNPKVKFSDALIDTNLPNLKILPVGTTIPNMTELLSSANIRQLCDELSQRYQDRVVIFDSPPLMQTSESRVMANLVGQVLFVVAAEQTPQSVVKEALSLLSRDKPIGLVLNKSRMESSSGYYYGYRTHERRK